MLPLVLKRKLPKESSLGGEKLHGGSSSEESFTVSWMEEARIYGPSHSRSLRWVILLALALGFVILTHMSGFVILTHMSCHSFIQTISIAPLQVSTNQRR